jgi:predicted RNase H-like nuclease (RuvC/YqgF family)
LSNEEEFNNESDGDESDVSLDDDRNIHHVINQGALETAHQIIDQILTASHEYKKQFRAQTRRVRYLEPRLKSSRRTAQQRIAQIRELRAVIEELRARDAARHNVMQELRAEVNGNCNREALLRILDSVFDLEMQQRPFPRARRTHPVSGQQNKPPNPGSDADT